MSLRDRTLIRRAVRMNERYAEDGGGYLAAAIAFYGFLSLFPLILLALSVIGFALAARPELQAEMRDAVAGSIPGLRSIVGKNLVRIEAARAGAGLVGLVGLLWTGSGVVGAGRDAVRRIFREGRPQDGLADKARVLGVTIGLGLLGLTATGLAATAVSLDAGGTLGPALRVGGALVAFGLDLGLFLLTYRVLAGRGKQVRRLLPGAMFAAIGWTGLKLLGTWYATLTVERSGSVYGPFAATVGVLVILYLAARLFVYGAELNAVLIEEKGGGPMGGPNGGRRKGGNPPDVSTVRLVGQVAGDVGTLVKKEVELARQEITEAITARVKALAAFVVIGVIALFIVGFLGAAGAAALAQILPLWLALLVVAGVFVVLAGLALALGVRRIKKPPLKPEKTKQTIKEDVEWAKAQLRR
ncbi:MAG: YhjD/YihY/BrkB family envelope integrity protein [Actinomycetota bacterium]